MTERDHLVHGEADARQPLFESGAYVLHSGESSVWKVNCDALTDGDWFTIAHLIRSRVGCFSAVEGVPTGGTKLASALAPYVSESGPLLIVDDVLTTGASMEAQRNGREATGFVVFARGTCPPWVRPLWSFGEADARCIECQVALHGEGTCATCEAARAFGVQITLSQMTAQREADAHRIAALEAYARQLEAYARIGKRCESENIAHCAEDYSCGETITALRTALTQAEQDRDALRAALNGFRELAEAGVSVLRDPNPKVRLAAMLKHLLRDMESRGHAAVTVPNLRGGNEWKPARFTRDDVEEAFMDALLALDQDGPTPAPKETT